MQQDVAFKEYNFNQYIKNTNKEELINLANIIIQIINNELSKKQKECIYQYIFQGKKMKEIAKEQGVCISSISRAILRAKLNILKYLKYSKAVDKYVSTKTYDD